MKTMNACDHPVEFHNLCASLGITNKSYDDFVPLDIFKSIGDHITIEKVKCYFFTAHGDVYYHLVAKDKKYEEEITENLADYITNHKNYTEIISKEELKKNRIYIAIYVPIYGFCECFKKIK